MKKMINTLLCCALAFLMLFSIISCSDTDKGKLTLADVKENLEIYELKYTYEDEDLLGWEYEINEQFELDGYDLELEDSIKTIIRLKSTETYVFEFSSKKDAKNAEKVLKGWENESSYDEFSIVQSGSLVIFGEARIVSKLTSTD